jgi:kumamolisin
VTPAFYQRGTGRTRESVGALGCIDVLSGNNTTDHLGGYVAGKGYDAASGWVTPDGKKPEAVLPD